jgi:hypothetical protein
MKNIKIFDPKRVYSVKDYYPSPYKQLPQAAWNRMLVKAYYFIKQTNRNDDVCSFINIFNHGPYSNNECQEKYHAGICHADAFKNPPNGRYRSTSKWNEPYGHQLGNGPFVFGERFHDPTENIEFNEYMLDYKTSPFAPWIQDIHVVYRKHVPIGFITMNPEEKAAPLGNLLIWLRQVTEKRKDYMWKHLLKEGWHPDEINLVLPIITLYKNTAPYISETGSHCPWSSYRVNFVDLSNKTPNLSNLSKWTIRSGKGIGRSNVMWETPSNELANSVFKDTIRKTIQKYATVIDEWTGKVLQQSESDTPIILKELHHVVRAFRFEHLPKGQLELHLQAPSLPAHRRSNRPRRINNDNVLGGALQGQAI